MPETITPLTPTRPTDALDLSTPIKFLRADGTGPYSRFPWPLPDGDQPGAWVAVAGPLVACKVGIHCTTLTHWRAWRSDRMFVVETDGPVLAAGDKSVCGRARLVREIAAWNPRTLCLFAITCAERVLPLFESRYPDDRRPRETLAVARRYASGAATADELRVAYQAARLAAANAAYAAADAAANAARRWQDDQLLAYLQEG